MMDPASAQLELDQGELQLKVDFFRKLGYSPAEVRAALKKVGLSTDTNSVLGELVNVRTSFIPSTVSLDNDDMGAGQKESPATLARAVAPHRVTPPPSQTPTQLDVNKEADVELKHIVIDGSNVAMSHGNKEVFSCQGILLAVKYFQDRGHTNITVFVPSWRKEQPRPDAPISNQNILAELEKQKIIVFTPSRRVGGKRVVCYDDRFIVKLAYESDGVIVSNDTYRDLQSERPEWKKCIEEHLLMYSFVNNKFMPPDDPLGRHGPCLDNFLRKKPLPEEQKRPLCPYSKKCTYGIKCKFYHPERANQSYRSLADELRENAKVSAVREERKPRRLIPTDPGSTPNHFSHSLEHELEHRLSLDHGTSLHPSDYPLLCWDGCRSTRTPMAAVPAEGPPEWPGVHPGMEPKYAGVSLEAFDSGLGSYESHCENQCHSKPYLPPQHVLPPASHPPMHAEGQASPSGCSCLSPASTPSPRCQSLESHCLHRYNGYPQPHLYPRPHHHHPCSFPGQPQQCGPQNHQRQHQYEPKYWSDPFHRPTQARSSCGLPDFARPPAPLSHSCSYGGEQGHPWGHPQPPPPSGFGPERLELRKKLQAIFNPSQVDAVMGMFPHLTDPQKLAQEILNLKSWG